jgi:hypothetical protein
MKIFIVKILFFFFPFVFIVLLISSFDNADRNSSKNENIIKLRCKSRFDSLDVLFVGNSYTYSGINIHLLDSTNVKAFNLGIATAGPYFYKLVVDDYLLHATKPKAILLLVSPMTFSSKADNFAAYPIHRYLDTSLTNEKIMWRYSITNGYIDLMQKSFEKGFSHILKFKLKTKKNLSSCGDLEIRKGFVPSNAILDRKVTRDTEYLYLDLKVDEFNKQKGEYLLSFAEELGKKGIHVMFYTLPTNRLENYFSDEYCNTYKDYIGQLQKKHVCIATELPEDNQYFRNIDHLNSIGAKRVTNELLLKTRNFKFL